MSGLALWRSQLPTATAQYAGSPGRPGPARPGGSTYQLSSENCGCWPGAAAHHPPGPGGDGIWRPQAGRRFKNLLLLDLFYLITMLRIAASIAVLAASASAYVSTPALVSFENEFILL